jgi:hypothetical protein
MIVRLAKQLARDDKALIDNSAYRRRLRLTPGTSGNPGPAVEIDPGKLTTEARYDGLFVLRRTPRITPMQAVRRYRDLLHVEDLFRRASSRPRPLELTAPPSAIDGVLDHNSRIRRRSRQRCSGVACH